MDLWSVIPIGVHHYTILSTMVSSIPLGNILWKDTTCKDLLRNESYLVISFHHSTLQLSYTTQAWKLKFKTYVMQANIWNAHSNASIKFMSLLPLLMCLNLIDPLLYHFSFPMFNFSPPIFVNYFFPFVINDHKGSILDRLRLSMSINGVRIIFPNLV